MNLHRTLSTSRRVLTQLSHDKRTLALIVLVPSVLLIVLYYTFDSQKQIFNYIAPMTLGIFPLILMFIVTSITTLRERRSGTLERLMTMPIAKIDFIVGYGLAFSLLALIQAGLASFVVLYLLDVTVLGSTLALLLCALMAGLLGTTLGLFVSAFATSEFQAVQFMPALIFPQLLTCGLFVPRDDMHYILQWFSDVMPLTYSVDALKQVTDSPSWTTDLTIDLIVVAGCTIVALLLGAMTIRRHDNH